MGTKPVDLNIHRALVQAVAECIIMKAPDQILFIADFLEKLNSASPAFEQQRQIHEDCTTFSTEPLMDLCDALEAAHSSRESYIYRIMTVLRHFVPASRSIDTSDPNIVFDSRGCCDYCNNYKSTILPNWQTDAIDHKKLIQLAESIKTTSMDSDFDCIIGLSGGLDSFDDDNVHVRNDVVESVVGFMRQNYVRASSERPVQSAD
jgi:hypothetical protein